MLYTEAILGNRVFAGAIVHAEEMLRRCNGDVEAALVKLARYDVSASFARGAIAGVGGFATLLVTVPATVVTSWLVGMRLVRFLLCHSPRGRTDRTPRV